jgi:hypothetical protein
VWTVFTTTDGLLANHGQVTVDPTGAVWVVHDDLPEEIAAALDVEQIGGISRFDGTAWQLHPDVGGRRAGTVSADGTLWLPSDEGIVGSDGTRITRLVVGPDRVPPLAPIGNVLRLDPTEELGPVRVSTAIGEIDFTTWVVPEGGDLPWWLGETDHGVLGVFYPEMDLRWSSDGTTWTRVPLSMEPSGWAAYDDELIVFGGYGPVRRTWDGAGWAEGDPVTAPRLDRGAIGPKGAVATRGGLVYFWDGARFIEASRPPDPSLHPEASASCGSPGWSGEGIMANLGPMVATNDGFLVLAARNEADWYKDPVCQPLVWFSPDGDSWTVASEQSPFGERAFVLDMAVVGSRIVAVGGLSGEEQLDPPDEAALWVSDDGLEWQRADLEADVLWQVAGGTRGWVVIGHHRQSVGAVALDGDMWFSADGLVWDGPYERPPGWGGSAGMGGVAMLDDRIIGVGEQWYVMPSDSAPAGVVVGVFVD